MAVAWWVMRFFLLALVLTCVAYEDASSNVEVDETLLIQTIVDTKNVQRISSTVAHASLIAKAAINGTAQRWPWQAPVGEAYAWRRNAQGNQSQAPVGEAYAWRRNAQGNQSQAPVGEAYAWRRNAQSNQSQAPVGAVGAVGAAGAAGAAGAVGALGGRRGNGSQAPVGAVGGRHVETTHKSWFSRMGESFTAFVVGLILVFMSFPCMWVNERRSARIERLLELGKEECDSVSAEQSVPDNHGCLVHVSGAEAVAQKPIQDDRFPSFQFEAGCLRISSTVEAFQWRENSKSETTKDNLGGGETTSTTYEYYQEWSSILIDSSNFKEQGYYNQLANPGIDLGLKSKTCSLVHLGEVYQLPRGMVDQLCDFTVYTQLGDSVDDFQLSDADQWYYYPSERSQPEVGDMRVQFKYIPDGPATAIGLQYSESGSDRESFLPYRVVNPGVCCCAVAEEDMPALRIEEGMKDNDEVYQGDKVTLGPLDLCCYCCLGACNLVTWIFQMGGVQKAEIYSLFPGRVRQSECFSRLAAQATTTKWACRILSWLLMLIGFNMLFTPLTTFIDIVPFLGKYLSSFVGWVVFGVSFVLTGAIAVLFISFAYLAFHPLLGMAYLFCAAAIIFIPMVVIRLAQS